MVQWLCDSMRFLHKDSKVNYRSLLEPTEEAEASFKRSTETMGKGVKRNPTDPLPALQDCLNQDKNHISSITVGVRGTVFQIVPLQVA